MPLNQPYYQANDAFVQVWFNLDMIWLPLIYSSAWKTSATKPMAPSATTVSENWQAYRSIDDVPDILHKSMHCDMKLTYIAILNEKIIPGF